VPRGDIFELLPLGAVDATRLGDLVGHVTAEELWGLDEALLTVLGVG
jgi:hypothetical protein